MKPTLKLLGAGGGGLHFPERDSETDKASGRLEDGMSGMQLREC